MRAGGASPERVGVLGGWRETLLLAWLFGVSIGLIQVLILVVRRYGFGRFVWVSREAVWMTPLAYTLFFLPLALLLAVVPGPLRPLRRIWVGSFVFLGVFSLLLPFGQIARWAAALVALGLGVQTGRLYSERPRVRRLALPVAAVTTVAIALAGAALAGGRSARQRGAVAGLPAPPDGAPNILLIILDTVRDENLSLYGYERQTTPALERLAADATVFDRAFATAPWTLTSHGTLLTGRYAGETGGDFRVPIPPEGQSLPELFHERGYRTAAFVANLLYTSWESGLASGFQELHDYRISPRLVLTHSILGQTDLAQRLMDARTPRAVLRAFRRGSPFELQRLPADQVIPATAITDRFLRWQARLGERPFFAFLNYFDAHGPYRAPAGFVARFDGAGNDRNRYDAAIAFLDAELDRLLAELERRGALDRTIVVITSDHGELFGEHGLKGHANALFLPLLKVPLLVRYPAAVPQGTRIAEPVTLRDLPVTVLTLAGVAEVRDVPGISLDRLWTGGETAGSAILAELTKGVNVDSTFPNARTGLESVLEGRYQYIRNGFGAEQLYDWVADSLQQHDLAGRPEGAAPLARLRHVLDSVRVQR